MAGVDDLTKNLKDVKIEGDLNILLLGETGVGKSTFINALANYLSFKDFKSAESDKVVTLIPSTFTVVDKNFKHTKVSVKTDQNDQNENIKAGESATQDVKTYVFPIYDNMEKIRLIDTPGLGDTRGIEQDEINCENILSYLTGLHQLHAICILLKPTITRLTVGFEYCIKKILSHLHKSAADNIIFCFTNTRGSNFTPGETFTCIEEIIKSVKNSPPHVEIPFEKNKFCFDNEAYRYLAAVQNGVELGDNRSTAVESWKKSSEACKNMLVYIHGDKNNKPLVPHMVKTTISINETRKMINQLSQPLLDISQNIENNIRVLERHKNGMDADGQTLEELKSKLYMPVIKLKEIKLDQPVTVCASASCVDVVRMEGNINKTNFKTKCHNPCYLTNIPKEIVGDRGLINCAAMGGTKNCTKCSCSFLAHMHIYYMTEKFADREIDKNIQLNINTKQDAIVKSREFMQQFQTRIDELKLEHEKVVEAAAMFAHFLQNNAITPFNDCYASYINHLISREKSYGRNADMDTIHHLEKLKKRYDELKSTFEEALKKGDQKVNSPEKIRQTVENLYKLKHMGRLIKDLYHAQKTARKKEYKNSEYVHKYKEKKEESKKNTKAPTKPQGKGPNRKPPQANKKQNTQNNKKQHANTPPPSYDQIGPQRNYGPPPPNASIPPLYPPYTNQPPPPLHAPVYSNPPAPFPMHSVPPSPQPNAYVPPVYSSRGSTEVKITFPYPDDRHHYPNERRPYPDDRRPYVDDRRPYPDDRRPYPDDRRPYPDDRRYYADDRRPYPDDRRPYPDDRRPYPDDRRPYPDDRRSYPDERRPYPEDRRFYDNYRPNPEPYGAHQQSQYPQRFEPPRGEYVPPASAAPPNRDYAKYGGNSFNKSQNNNPSTRGQQGRGRGGRGRGNFKKNVNRKGKGHQSSDSDDSDASSVFSYKDKKN